MHMDTVMNLDMTSDMDLDMDMHIPPPIINKLTPRHLPTNHIIINVVRSINIIRRARLVPCRGTQLLSCSRVEEREVLMGRI